MAAKKNLFKLEKVSIRMVSDAPIMSGYPIHSAKDAVRTLGDLLCEMDREVICIINMKTDGTPINCTIVSIGAIDQAITNPREMLKASILSNAANMLILHNHPSGNLSPSKHDTMLTDRMVQVCDLMGIPLLDHIIIGADNEKYFSFREKDVMPYANIHLENDYNAIKLSAPMVAEQQKKEVR